MERTRTRRHEYIKDLRWSRLELRRNEMQSVLVDREVWKLLPLQPVGKAGEERKMKSIHLITVNSCEKFF